MTSEIKVDTISEQTSANGVTIDGLTIKDGNIIGDVALAGTTPTFTIGDAGAEDASLIFDGNAQDFYVALDDSADDLVIGLGNTIGTTPIMSFDESKNVTIHDGTLKVESDNANALVAPLLQLDRISSSPADGDLIGAIRYTARLDNGNSAEFAGLEAKIIESSTADGEITLNIAKGGNVRSAIKANNTEVIINDASEDIDFRVESNGNANMLFVDGGSNLVGIGADPDLGAGLHIKTADSGASVNANRDELVIEGSGNSGMTILSGTSNVGGVAFGDSGNNLMGLMQYNHATNNFEFNTNSSANPLILNDTGNMSTNGEVVPDTSAGGITLNQGANDTNILTFKSSDISHGFTGQFEADTYGVFKKNNATAGGLQILGIAEDDPGINIFGVADTTSGTVASNTNAVIHIDARKTTGGSVGTIGTDMMCLFSNDGVAKVIFTGAGNIHSDSSATVGTYDAYEDAHLVRAYDLSHGKGVIDSKFDKFVSYNAEKLADLELIGRDDDGTPNHFVNVTGFQRLHNGAIWQQYEKTERLANAMYELAKAAVGEEKANEILEQNEIKLLN